MSAEARPLTAGLRNPPQGQNALKYVLGNGIALLTGLVVAYVMLLRGGQVSTLTIRTGDFIQYFAISHLILGSHGGAIYDFHLLSQVEAVIIRPLSLQHGVLPYLYPPYFALVAAPLALLPYSAAYLVWLLVNCGVLVLTLFVFENYSGLQGRAAAAVRLAVICSLPMFMTLALGQVSLIILGLLTTCFFAARSGRHELAGVMLALALIKPPYVLPVLLVFLVQKRWRSLLAFAATCAALLIAPIPLLGISINKIYVQLLAEATKWQGKGTVVTYQHMQVAGATYDPHVNNSLAGTIQLLFSENISRIVTALLVVVVLAMLARFAWRNTTLDVSFGLAVVAALLINPHVLTHDLVLLVLPVFIALRMRRSGPRVLPWLLVGVYVLVTIGYSLSYAIPVQLSVVGMLALGGWLWTTARQNRRSEVTTSNVLSAEPSGAPA